MYWWSGGILLIPLTYLYQTGDEDEEESWLRIVFDQNLNAAGAGIAVALLEKQVGVKEDPVCSQTVRAFQGSGCEVLVQYNSPADTARVLRAGDLQRAGTYTGYSSI